MQTIFVCSLLLNKYCPCDISFINVSQIKATNENTLAVEIFMEVKFLKYTFIKGMIESSTNSEMTKWLEALFAKMKMVTLC